MEERNQRLIKKLRMMVKAGTLEESKLAQLRLNNLLRKYHLSEADLEEDAIKDFEFRYSGKLERKLLLQIIYRVLKSQSRLSSSVKKYVSGKGQRTVLIVECTEAENIEIHIQFEFYTKLFKKEMDTLTEAFIQKHRLFGTMDEPIAFEKNDENIMRIVNMAAALSDEKYVKLLPEVKTYGR